jgi:hypothetical protein
MVDEAHARAGRRVTIPIRFSAVDRAQVRGARLLRANACSRSSTRKAEAHDEVAQGLPARRLT